MEPEFRGVHPIPSAPALSEASPIRSLECSPISGRLGLGDVVVRAETGALRTVRATVRGTAQGSPPVSIELRPGEGPLGADGAGTTVWSGRFMVGNEANTSDAAVDIEVDCSTMSGGTVSSGPLRASTAPDPRIASPDWAKGAVWYQVFPERFRNGNPANDPDGADSCLLPWNSDWSAVAPEEAESVRAQDSPPRVGRAGTPGSLWQRVVTRRRYGGDLQGLTSELDSLKHLGVTALYLTPVFQARSLHKYDASDFRHIDCTLGDPGSPSQPWSPDGSESIDPATWRWTPADRYFLDTLLPAAHRRGMRIVLDGVWNHTGIDFWAFRDVRARGKTSPFAGWYQVSFSSPDATTGTPGGALQSWQSWNGLNGTLPKFRHTDDGSDLVAPVKNHVFDVTRRWMDPNADGDPSDGIDGWRLDVAAEVPMGFWSSWRAHVKRTNPDAFLAGELWFKGDDYFKGRAFDAQMNYPFARPVVDWLRSAPGAESSEALASALTRAFDLEPQTALVQMNLLSSHDTQRLLSAIANPAFPYDSGGSPEDVARGYDRSRPDRDCFELALVGLAIQAMYLGSPMIYSGEEWGMHGAKDPDCRKPVPWPDLGPTDNPADAHDQAFRDAASGWFSMRSNPQFGAVIRYGDVRHCPPTDARVFSFERSLNGSRVIVVANASSRAFDASTLVPAGAEGIGPARADASRVPPRSTAAFFIHR